MVNKFGVLLLSLLVVVHLNRSCAEKLPTGTGPSSQLSRIAYGSEASILEYPYMVNIWVKSETIFTKYLNEVIKVINWFLPLLNLPIIKEIEEEPADFHCGGTLLSQKCILTAAHCVFDNDKRRLRPKEMFEFYGGNDTRGEGISLPKMESVFHDDYDTHTWDMDVAIIKLTEPVEDPNLKTVEIDYSEVDDDEIITVVGWGRTENRTSSTTLKKTNIMVMNTEECRSLYDQTPLPWKVTENTFCAKGLRETSHCAGDTGGPIIRNGKQIGITSFGNIFCGLFSRTVPGAYTKLSSARVSEFLSQTIANNC